MNVFIDLTHLTHSKIDSHSNHPLDKNPTLSGTTSVRMHSTQQSANMSTIIISWYELFRVFQGIMWRLEMLYNVSQVNHALRSANLIVTAISFQIEFVRSDLPSTPQVCLLVFYRASHHFTPPIRKFTHMYTHQIDPPPPTRLSHPAEVDPSTMIIYPFSTT